MSKKACIITTVHPPFDTRIFHKEAKTLVKTGYDVTLIVQHDKNEVVDGIKLIALPKPRNRLGRIFGLTWRAFRVALRQQADVYHFHDPEIIPVGLFLKLLGKKVIYDVHEDVPKQILSKEWIPRLLRRLVAGSAYLTEAVAGRAVSAVVAATPQIAKRFPAAKTVVVQNFPIPDELVPENAAPYHDHPPKVAYVGGITVIRGIREMVQAMSVLPEDLDARLALAGAFAPPALEDEVKRLPGWERVEFLGWQDRAGVSRILSQSRVGLVIFHPEPNNISGWPNKLFDTPSACGGVVHFPQEIAQAIEYLLTNPEDAQRMGENGRQAVQEKYNWETEGKKLLKLYAELMGSLGSWSYWVRRACWVLVCRVERERMEEHSNIDSPGARVGHEREDKAHELIRRASTFNTERIDHIYRDPHDPDVRLFLHYGDLANGEQMMIEREQGVDDVSLALD